MSELIENCAVLTVKDALKSIHSAKPVEVASNGREFGIQCQFNTATDASAILTNSKGEELQEIALEWIDLTYGRTAFFICECGYRAKKLYQPPGAKKYLCRRCHGLRYELSSINRNSLHGKLFYRTNRMIKLANQRADLRYIFYEGRYTHRYERFLTLCERAGLNEVVNDARELLKAVKAQSF